MEQLSDVSDAWEHNAQQWLAWARTPEHDVYYWRLNLPAFAELVPDGGRRTLDIGCGEGRIGRWLETRATVLQVSIARQLWPIVPERQAVTRRSCAQTRQRSRGPTTSLI